MMCTMPHWRKQFVCKTASSPLWLGEEIKYVRGATVTSKHLTEGVKRVLVLYEIALKEEWP